MKSRSSLALIGNDELMRFDKPRDMEAEDIVDTEEQYAILTVLGTPACPRVCAFSFRKIVECHALETDLGFALEMVVSARSIRETLTPETAR